MEYFKAVTGLLSDVEHMKQYEGPVVVQITSDKEGNTLSLGAANVMIHIDLNSVSDILQIIKEGKDD